MRLILAILVWGGGTEKASFCNFIQKEEFEMGAVVNQKNYLVKISQRCHENSKRKLD